MKFGLMFVNSGPFSNHELLAHLAQTAEQCGFDSLWTVEHVVIPQDYKSPYPYSKSGKIPGGEDVPIPDPLLPLSFAAALTKTIRLATGVVILPQRHPLYLAKEIATLDLLSGGRVILGVGSGWLKEEFDALGLDFHTRGARTDEAITAMRACWREDPSNFHGKHFNFGPLRSFPKPPRGKVPVHIGGHSIAAARRAGRLGDGFFPAIGEVQKLQDLFGTMRTAAQQAGRNPDQIELSCMARAAVDTVKLLADIGISRVVVAPPAFDKAGLSRGLEKIGDEVISRV
ncbi:MAG: TIGR03619 family F420-dependent LLM class oxidoreductase [Deltaproteobacteria bacterium]|nr:TIGR03619 family F420-dependent LLM class oxidoreductase [Deltaproteobacteria bacterium]